MSETTALVVAEQPKAQGAIILKDALKLSAEQRSLLVKFVHEQMVEGMDYGTIPGAPKPCLYKPGAEKLTNLYRCDADIVLHKEIEDWDRPLFYYRFKAKLKSRDTTAVLGVGYGSCNSRETKYRWRDAKRKCSKCQAETLFKSKDKPEFFCWSKKGGCGATFSDKDPSILGQALGRVENPDVADLVNTILKMATKRAHVAAALQLAGCSDLFTQDLEDMPHTDEPAPLPPKAEPPKPEPKQETKPAPRPQAGQAVTMKEQPKPAPTAAQAEAQFQKDAAEICKKEGHSWDLKTGVCNGCGAQELRAPAQPPAIRARARKVWDNAKAKNMTAEKFQEWAAINLGRNVPSTEWTDNEVGILEVASREPPDEPGAAG